MMHEPFVSEEEKVKENKLPENAKKYAYINEDPYSDKGIINSIFYYWAYRIIKLANLTPIKNEYLGKMIGKFKSIYFLQKIKYVWEDKKYKFKKSIPLIKAGFRANINYIIFMFFFCFLRSIINIVLISIFRQYTKMFSNTPVPEEEKTFLDNFTHVQIGIFYLVIKLSEAFIMRKGFEYQHFMAIKSGVEFNCLIYDKLLKISPSSMKERAQSGEVLNYMQVDSHKLSFLMLSSPDLLTIPIQIISYSYMLFKFFGVSFFFGLFALGVFMFINFVFMKKFKKLQKEQMRLKDLRMKITSETFNNIKVLKLYNWEDEFLDRINKAREDEIKNLETRFYFSSFTEALGWLSPVATAVVSIGAYQYFNSTLKIEDIFTCLGIFESFNFPLRMIPGILNNFFETKIATERIKKYLFEEEINDRNVIKGDKDLIEKGIMVKIENGNFSWGVPIKDTEDYKEMERKAKLGAQKKDSKNSPPSDYGPVELSTSINSGKDDNLPSKYSSITSDLESKITSTVSSEPIIPVGGRTILKNINLEIKKGEFICIIGEVGSGKSSLLQAILNNMLPKSNQTKLYLNGTVSYVSQIPWIQNATVKNNILFYQNFNEEKYNKVIDLCELRQDLEILVGGDMTEIGEKGINLSGGQKARITLARALYAEKDIYIFDDPISALDAHVGMNVMQNCIVGYLKDKTRILVTHALQYVSYADRIIYLKDGEIAWEGTYDEIKRQDFFTVFYEKMKTLNRKNSAEAEKEDKEAKEAQKSEKADIHKTDKVKRITKDEEKEEGRVSKDVYKAYFNFFGTLPLFAVIGILLFMQGFKGSSNIWLGYWSEHQEENRNNYYFFIYCLLGFSGCLINYIRIRITQSSSIKVSRLLHTKMIESLIRAPISTFHETIPKGQIFNRLSKEVNNIDVWCLRSFTSILENIIAFAASIFICSLYQPYCLIFLPILTIVGYKISEFYTNCSRELNRLEGILRSPTFNLINETIPGTVTIRAYNYQSKYMELFHERIDEHLKIRIILMGTSQWFDLVLDLLSFSFIAFLITFTIAFKDNFSAKVIGLLLTYCVSLQRNLMWGLHSSTSFENSMVGLERCLAYTKCPSEAPKSMPIDTTLDNWPTEGRIKFENYFVKYRPDTEIVLKNLNFEVFPREKIGIVGRTGSGKSTISLCLFRILEPLNGKIFIDGIDITTIGLGKLRSSLTIIPQDPSLMEGTLRYNIDPLNLYSDKEIISVMKKIEFDYILSNGGLMQIISEGGSNLSVGEKQLICISRAILRKSKIVIMDEATANIDYKTEEIIQKAINEILADSTVLTIAHRIKTILNYNRVIALADGEIVDFDNPKKLLEKKKGLFYELYTKSTL